MQDSKDILQRIEKVKEYMKYLESIGVIKVFEDGSIQVVAEKMEFGVAEAPDGRKALAIFLQSFMTKLKMMFLLEDREMLAQLSRAIDAVLKNDSKDVV